MLELLQARERIGVPELARRLEVGERTVRRYAAMLREMGIPVEAEVGRYGGQKVLLSPTLTEVSGPCTGRPENPGSSGASLKRRPTKAKTPYSLRCRLTGSLSL